VFEVRSAECRVPFRARNVTDYDGHSVLIRRGWTLPGRYCCELWQNGRGGAGGDARERRPGGPLPLGQN
jgi:hypothetical protein